MIQTPTRSNRQAIQWLQRRQNMNTRRTYHSSFNGFYQWMKSRNRNLQQTDDSDVVLYIRHLLEGKESVSGSGTILVAISSIRDHFKYDSDKMKMLNSTMVSDAMKIGKRDAKKVVKKKPLTVEMLMAMHAWYTDETSRVYRSDQINWIDVRDLCMMILMMAAFLRESEVIMILATVRSEIYTSSYCWCR